MKRILFILLFTFSNTFVLLGNVFPNIGFIVDKNLVWSFSLGATYYPKGISHYNRGYFYICNISKKGTNMSIGYTGNYQTIFGQGIAINRMKLNDKDGKYEVFWGLEYDFQVFFTGGKFGIMKKYNKNITEFSQLLADSKKLKNYRINAGAGFFVPQLVYVKSLTTGESIFN
ncbi:MAG: hypothetical protein CBD21_02555 [bacterium TMED161]|nr:MAG: hypothetical protein CBD21_02555 [bacterium TMED161]|tara:strand:+ start:378 stop:893 length:516 start_codon:yes stop_codon:yes gene_type:complete